MSCGSMHTRMQRVCSGTGLVSVSRRTCVQIDCITSAQPLIFTQTELAHGHTMQYRAVEVTLSVFNTDNVVSAASIHAELAHAPRTL